MCASPPAPRSSIFHFSTVSFSNNPRMGPRSAFAVPTHTLAAANVAATNEGTISARCCVRLFGKAVPKLGWKVSDCEIAEEVADAPSRRSSAPRRYDAVFDATAPM